MCAQVWGSISSWQPATPAWLLTSSKECWLLNPLCDQPAHGRQKPWWWLAGETLTKEGNHGAKIERGFPARDLLREPCGAAQRNPTRPRRGAGETDGQDTDRGPLLHHQRREVGATMAKKGTDGRKPRKRGDALRPLSHHVLGCDDWAYWPHTFSQYWAVAQIELRERGERCFEHIPKDDSIKGCPRGRQGLHFMRGDRCLASKVGGRGRQWTGQQNGGDYPPSDLATVAGLISRSNPSTIETKRHFLPQRKMGSLV
jgi:hypothetical protein